MAKKEMVCTACGSLVDPESRTPGSFWIELLLWLAFIIPGLIYTIWRLTTTHDACPKCGGKTLVPPGSPVGSRLLGDRAPQERTRTDESSRNTGVSLRAIVSSWTFWMIVAILVIFATTLLCRVHGPPA